MRTIRGWVPALGLALALLATLACNRGQPSGYQLLVPWHATRVASYLPYALWEDAKGLLPDRQTRFDTLAQCEAVRESLRAETQATRDLQKTGEWKTLPKETRDRVRRLRRAQCASVA
jgi:hypothetical protein